MDWKDNRGISEFVDKCSGGMAGSAHPAKLTTNHGFMI